MKKIIHYKSLIIILLVGIFALNTYYLIRLNRPKTTADIWHHILVENEVGELVLEDEDYLVQEFEDMDFEMNEIDHVRQYSIFQKENELYIIETSSGLIDDQIYIRDIIGQFSKDELEDFLGE